MEPYSDLPKSLVLEASYQILLIQIWDLSCFVADWQARGRSRSGALVVQDLCCTPLRQLAKLATRICSNWLARFQKWIWARVISYAVLWKTPTLFEVLSSNPNSKSCLDICLSLLKFIRFVVCLHFCLWRIDCSMTVPNAAMTTALHSVEAARYK